MTNNAITHLFLAGFILLLFLLVVPHSAAAQSKIQVTSFQRMETDITARITAPQRDQNGEICALIRIVTTEKDFMFEPDALGVVARENKPGEIWLYVPRGARRISIMHEKYGVLRNYFYPDLIEKATVYEMELSAGDEAKEMAVDTNMQLVVMRPEPAIADIYIDDEKMPTEKGLFTATMKKGTHTYRVEAPMYAPEAGIIDLGSEQKIMSVALKPRFGYLEVFSLPEQDAKVYIDNELAGETPYKSDRMPLKDYQVRVEKEFFFPMDSTIVITAGETSSLTFKMKSTIKPKEPRRTLVMLEAGWHPSQTSFGAMVGFVVKNGAYVRFRSDFGSVSADLECDDTGALTGGGNGTPYYKEGVTQKARMSVTAGYMRRIAKPLYAYIGAGYGSRTLAWETVEDELVKNTDHSATGVAAEIGAIGRFGKFAVSVGCQTVNFKYMELSAGIGFFF
ncbi:PEGA domain-containing protein [uncultured Bacteroides sp.]|uniref:PEGA domain-containing protein n=1 Tax=uncultured Bacteroides sp. TaxID=162156 RepID=UPI0026318BCA|nr:PEGA domain-containing protein [uncultured Bacteroides sp.]